MPGIDVNDNALYLFFGREVLQLQFLAVITGSRNSIAAARALTIIVEVRSEKDAPPGFVPETRIETDSRMLWLRRCCAY